AGILKWHILEQMSLGGYAKGVVDFAAFCRLVINPEPKEFFDKGNMRAIRNLCRFAGEIYSKSLDSIRDRVFVLSSELMSDVIRDTLEKPVAYQAPLAGEPLVFGVGSNWEERLSQFERLVLRIATCTGCNDGNARRCVQQQELRDSLIGISSPDAAL